MDNQGAIQLAKNPVFHSRTKHIGVHFNFTKDLVFNKEIKIEYIPTKDMIADIFTKVLDREKHTKFLTMMGLLPMLMIVPRSRGCVEQQVSASLCMLSTQSTNVTHNISQKEQEIQEFKINFDDPILSKPQAKEQDGHAQMAISHQRKQMARKACNKSKLSSSKD